MNKNKKMIEPRLLRVIYLDLETTGVDINEDRIVQIAALKITETGEEELKDILVNPTIPIPKEASDVHGITDDKVEDAPTFKQISKSLHKWLEGYDLITYNGNKFDLPLLLSEFKRVGIELDLDDVNLVDSLVIERLLNPKDLSSVYFRYTGKELEGAHDAKNDIYALKEILDKQNEILQLDPKNLELYQNDNQPRLDFTGILKYNEEEVVVWAIGKNKDQPIENDKGYLNWVLNVSNFHYSTKNFIRKILSDK